MSQLQYLEQPKAGETSWWSWSIVFWMMIMTWLVGQFIFGMGMAISALVTDPELMNEFEQMSTASLAEKPRRHIQYGQLVMIVSSIGAFLSLIFYLSQSINERQKSGLVTGIFVIISLIAMAIIAPNIFGDTEANAVANKMIGANAISYAFMLLTFPGALAGLYLGYKYVHRCELTKLHTSASKFRWRRAIRAFFIMWIVLAIAGTVMTYLIGGEFKFVFDAKRFFGFAIISLLLLPVQSATEEIVFRGYLNQGLMRYLKNKWVVFAITSTLFMAMHLANPEAISAADKGILPLVMSGYFFFGFACCLMVLIDDGLESAIGVHAGNNTFAALFVNYENSVLPTPSVFVTKADPVYDSISTIVILSIVLVILYYLNRTKTT